jgi:MFS family permease
VRIPRSKRRFGSVLSRPPVLLATAVGFLLVGTCAATEAAVIATFGQGDPRSGLVLAIWALASLAGGLALGRVPVGPWALAWRLAIVLVGSCLALAAWDFWSLNVALLVAGACIAPALAVIFAMVSSSVKFSDTAEAYGWVGTGQLIGAAAGSAVAGVLIDATRAAGGDGGRGGFWAAVAFAALGTLVPVLFRRAHPDLRGRDASPLPDTEPVPIQPS